jgi:integrase
MAAAVRDQRIARNPCEGLTLPRLPEPRQRFLTLDELQRLASEAGDYRVMVLVLGFCGLRMGECLALRVRWVDGLRRRLRVTESVSEVGGRLVWSTPKNHQSRDVPMPRTVAELVMVEATGKGPDDLLFTSPEGEPIRLPNWRRRVWAGAVLRAGRSGLTPHDLRHTAASLAIASGASVKGVQRMLGHKDAAMTLNVYASLFDDDLDLVSERLDVVISQAAVSSTCPGGAPTVALGRSPGNGKAS